MASILEASHLFRDLPDGNGGRQNTLCLSRADLDGVFLAVGDGDAPEGAVAIADMDVEDLESLLAEVQAELEKRKEGEGLVSAMRKRRRRPGPAEPMTAMDTPDMDAAKEAALKLSHGRPGSLVANMLRRAARSAGQR